MSGRERTKATPSRSVLVTGAGGYIGGLLVQSLAEKRSRLAALVATDIRLPAPSERLDGVDYRQLDIRDPGLSRLCEENRIDCLVHLAAVVSPGPKADRRFLYSVDVEGTRNVLGSCLSAKVDQLILTSSGAAYGYHPDNPEWLDEGHSLRGNREFAYSDHKRLVEEMLTRWRARHPEIRQLIFRPGTILGSRTENQITALFDKPYVLGLYGSKSPFVLIWDRDVVGAIEFGIIENRSGIFNMAGDGVLTLRQMAGMMKKPYIQIPVPPLKAVLWAGKRLGLTGYGPEQVDFLRYRPVLANERLKTEFGYRPSKTSREVFEHFLEARRANGRS